jgi:hypothetical protein
MYEFRTILAVLTPHFATQRELKWPRGLRRRCAAERLLGSWVRMPPGASTFVSFERLCCQVEVSATADPSSRGVLPTVVCV